VARVVEIDVLEDDRLAFVEGFAERGDGRGVGWCGQVDTADERADVARESPE